MVGNVAADTQFRRQDRPAATAAAAVFHQAVAREYSLFHTTTWAANKPSEHNAMNDPLTPAMVVRVYPGLKRPRMTYRILSRQIQLPLGG